MSKPRKNLIDNIKVSGQPSALSRLNFRVDLSRFLFLAKGGDRSKLSKVSKIERKARDKMIDEDALKLNRDRAQGIIVPAPAPEMTWEMQVNQAFKAYRAGARAGARARFILIIYVETVAEKC